jgi:hypothetical protein
MGAAAGLWLMRKIRQRREREAKALLPGTNTITIVSLSDEQVKKICEFVQTVSPSCTLYVNCPPIVKEVCSVLYPYCFKPAGHEGLHGS